MVFCTVHTAGVGIASGLCSTSVLPFEEGDRLDHSFESTDSSAEIIISALVF